MQRSTQPKKIHNYNKLDNPFPDLEQILELDDQDPDHMSSAKATYYAFTQTDIAGKDPKSIDEARQLPKWPKWEKTTKAELTTMKHGDMGTN